MLNMRTANFWRKTTFQRSENGWETNNGAEALMVLTRPGIRWTILTAESLAASSTALLQTEVLGYGDADVDTQPELLLHTCDAAVSLIAEFADIYLPWVSNVIRDLVPLRARPGIFSSGSIDLSPGVVCVSNSVSNHENPWALAEVLVHEATHQYLYIARRLGRMDDGKDDTLYFSPFRNTGRPIYNILITYHAFANVVLFYRTALAHGQSADGTSALVVQERVKELEQTLQPLEQALQSTRSLTPLGLALWEPLRGQLQS
jgi:HEXXH motif-containing protein